MKHTLLMPLLLFASCCTTAFPEEQTQTVEQSTTCYTGFNAKLCTDCFWERAELKLQILELAKQRRCEDIRVELLHRDTKISLRMDECMDSNEYFDCHYWMYGYYLDDDDDNGDPVPPPRPLDE